MKSRPSLPADLADVPVWLRSQARSWSFRILFLADALEMELEQRRALRNAATEAGIRVIDLPSGLTEPELQAFVASHLAEPAPSTAREVGRLSAEVLGLPMKVVRCPHCGDRFRHVDELSRHVRDTGDVAERPPYACVKLWLRRGGAG